MVYTLYTHAQSDFVMHRKISGQPASVRRLGQRRGLGWLGLLGAHGPL